MSILFADSFDHALYADYATNGYKWTTWDVRNGIGIGLGRGGTNCLVTENSAGPRNVIKRLAASETTLFMALYAREKSAKTNTHAYWSGVTFLANSGANAQLTVMADINGTIRVRSGTYAGSILASSDPLAFSFLGDHIEMKVVFHDTAGTVDVKVNGVSVISETGLDTQAAAYTGADTVSINSGANFHYIDDVVIWNASGSYNNDWLGDINVSALIPDADGNYTDFTPSAGNNYECVDGADPDETNYNSSSLATDVDTYSMGAISDTTLIVLAVISQLLLKKDVSDTRQARAVCRVSSVDYNGSDQPLADAYDYYQEVWEENPNTSSAWTPTIINGAEFGVETRGL